MSGKPIRLIHQIPKEMSRKISDEHSEEYEHKDLTKKIKGIVLWVEDWHIIKSTLRNLGITGRSYKSSGHIAYTIDLEKVRSKATERNIKSNHKTVLKQENMELIFKVLHEKTRVKDYVTMQDLVNATGLEQIVLKEILGCSNMTARLFSHDQIFGGLLNHGNHNRKRNKRRK